MLEHGRASSFRTGGLGDAVGAFVFEERKWDFCPAKEQKLCLQGGRDPCQLPMGTGLGGHEFVPSVKVVWLS